VVEVAELAVLDDLGRHLGVLAPLDLGGDDAEHARVVERLHELDLAVLDRALQHPDAHAGRDLDLLDALEFNQVVIFVKSVQRCMALAQIATSSAG